MVFNIACGKMTNPRTGLEGKFSMQYAVANALMRGDTGLHAFTDEKVNDPKIREFMKKIDLREKEGLSKLETIVEMETNSGAAYTKTADVIKEIPEIEGKRVKVTDKYLDICEPVLGPEKTKKTMELIQALEHMDNIKKFIELI
jgi:2-methylcitrate dehydratase PrpD